MEGTGDIVEALTRWHHQEDVITETSLTFSGQVFDFCKKNKLNTLAISNFNEKKSVCFDYFSAFSRPKAKLTGGIGYHLSQILHGLTLVGIAMRYRPQYLHVTNGATYWLILAPLKLFGIKIFPQFHNTFWAKGYAPTGRFHKLMLSLDAWFLTHIAAGAICCSPEIQRQIKEITHYKSCPTYVFKAQFYRSNFENPPPPQSHSVKPFTIIFAGRIERNKGVFDILDMADKLSNEHVIFHICGGGPVLEELKAECSQRQLEKQVLIHGRLNRPELLAIYTQGHAVIVPTRSDFCEGLPMVAIEAVLLGRPVITSSLSNALEVLGEAIVEAQAENTESYVAAIRKLIGDSSFYAKKCAACLPLSAQFLDGKQGLASVLSQTIEM